MGRTELGAADVSDARLEAMLAKLWEVEHVLLVDSTATEVAYELPALTTRSRHWVTGTGRIGDEERGFRLFVKQVQHWSLSPLFEVVPESLRAWASRTVPWQAEPLAYESDLADRLPSGLRMPRALGVFAPAEQVRSIWLEAVEPTDVEWKEEDYVEAAHLLGRLSGSPVVHERADLDPQRWDIGFYVEGRMSHAVGPALRAEQTWADPLVAEHFGRLRAGLVEVVDRVDVLADEFRAFPFRASHGDACPNNLLRVAGLPGFTLIDYGSWRPQPVGFDLGQLLVGDLQIGRRAGTGLADLDAAITAAWIAGAAQEGLVLDPGVVRRAHAVATMLMSGLSAIPLELLGCEETPSSRALFEARAALAAYCLEQLERT